MPADLYITYVHFYAISEQLHHVCAFNRVAEGRVLKHDELYALLAQGKLVPTSHEMMVDFKRNLEKEHDLLKAWDSDRVGLKEIPYKEFTKQFVLRANRMLTDKEAAIRRSELLNPSSFRASDVLCHWGTMSEQKMPMVRLASSTASEAYLKDLGLRIYDEPDGGPRHQYAGRFTLEVNYKMVERPSDGTGKESRQAELAGGENRQVEPAGGASSSIPSGETVRLNPLGWRSPHQSGTADSKRASPQTTQTRSCGVNQITWILRLGRFWRGLQSGSLKPTHKTLQDSRQPRITSQAKGQ